jgi:hypothetical protein
MRFKAGHDPARRDDEQLVVKTLDWIYGSVELGQHGLPCLQAGLEDAHNGMSLLWPVGRERAQQREPLRPRTCFPAVVVATIVSADNNVLAL